MKEIVAFFDSMKQTHDERVEIFPADRKDLIKIPEKLKMLYSFLSKAALPFGEIFSVESAVEDSNEPPFSPNWFNFGQDYYSGYWLCSYSEDSDGMSFLSWDHDTDWNEDESPLLEAYESDVISFLKSEYDDYKEDEIRSQEELTDI